MTFEAIDKTARFSTGFTRFDDSIGCLRSGLTYVLGGEQKSGKSSILYTWANHWLDKGISIGFINTEQTQSDFLNRMTANHLMIPADDVTPEDRKEWLSKYNLPYAGIETIANTFGTPEFNLAFARIQEFVQNGAQIILFDNLTTFGASATVKAAWEVIGTILNRLIVYAKQNNVVIISVIHTRKGLEVNESPSHIVKLLEAGQGEEIFTKSITVIRRPSASDLYGSNAGLSQCGGTFLLWRPYQKFPNGTAASLERLIIDSCTHGEATDIGLTFIGNQYRHEEVETKSITELYQSFRT